jgi:hypothetical protein
MWSRGTPDRLYDRRLEAIAARSGAAWRSPWSASPRWGGRDGAAPVPRIRRSGTLLTVVVGAQWLMLSVAAA